MNARKMRSEKQRGIARERIQRLFDMAESDRKMADRYVALARKIAMKVNLRLPSVMKRKFCKNCGAYLRPGVNCRVRTRNGKLVCYCFACRHIYRIPFLREKKSRKI